MRSKRNISLTATPESISYSALVAAITEHIKNNEEFIRCENVAELKAAITAAEKS